MSPQVARETLEIFLWIFYIVFGIPMTIIIIGVWIGLIYELFLYDVHKLYKNKKDKAAKQFGPDND